MTTGTETGIVYVTEIVIVNGIMIVIGLWEASKLSSAPAMEGVKDRYHARLLHHERSGQDHRGAMGASEDPLRRTSQCPVSLGHFLEPVTEPKLKTKTCRTIWKPGLTRSSARKPEG